MLAAQVKRVRQSHGLTQEQLAQAAGVTRQTVSNLERGTVPQDGILRKVLRALGIQPTSGGHASDTEMWLGIMGGILDALPVERRPAAGQAAVAVLTDALAQSSKPGVGAPEIPEQHQPARPDVRGPQEDVEHTNDFDPADWDLAAKQAPRKADTAPTAD